ncbi:MAG: hypothetical protein ABFS08_01080 [Pseudomonadota bacterium]
MNDDKPFIDRINSELNSQVEGLAPSTLGRLHAARNDALGTVEDSKIHRGWVPAMAASFFVAAVTSAIWFQASPSPEQTLDSLLQTASVAERQILDEGDDIELYRDLEFYYWLEHEQANAS